jgi:hypothetical protein
MKTYQCHKRVKAAQIQEVLPVDESKHVTLILDDGEKFHADGPMYMRYFPVVGDYLVEYEDGYRSISPQKAFEDGYTAVYADGS